MSKTLDGRTEQELEALCREWQARIGCADWDVKVKIGGLRDTGHPIADGDTSGTVDWVLAKKQALITLLDPRDYPSDGRWEQDHELTLVHELIHLLFAPFSAEDGTPADIAQEQAVHALSRALVTLKRANEPVPEPAGEICSTCAIPVYASDPKVTEGGLTWHEGCFHGKNGPDRREHDPKNLDYRLGPNGMPVCDRCDQEFTTVGFGRIWCARCHYRDSERREHEQEQQVGSPPKRSINQQLMDAMILNIPFDGHHAISDQES